MLRLNYNRNLSNGFAFALGGYYRYPFYITYSIITQIGRENKFSADIFALANSPLRTTEKSPAVVLYHLIT